MLGFGDINIAGQEGNVAATCGELDLLSWKDTCESDAQLPDHCSLSLWSLVINKAEI